MLSNANDCPHCKNVIEEKEKKLNVFRTNLIELKAKMIDSSNLISAYLNYKRENEMLKKEVESIKRGNVTPLNASVSYELEILRSKYLKEVEKNKNLQIANDQMSAMLEDMKDYKNNTSKSEFNKLKRELSEKEKYINSQNLLIEKLKSNNKQIPEKENPLSTFLEEDNNVNERNNFYKNLTPSGNLKEILEENEFLKHKYHKYHTKYVKFKYKYKQLKSLSKFFFSNLKFPTPSQEIQTNTVYEGRRSLSLEQDEQTEKLLQVKTQRKSTHKEDNKGKDFILNNKYEDIFETKNDDFLDLDISTLHEKKNNKVPIDEVEPTKTMKRKTKNSTKEQGNNQGINLNEEENLDVKKKKSKNSKEKNKPKEEKLEESAQTEDKVTEEIKPEVPNMKPLYNHINPLRKPKIDYNELEKQKRENFTNNFIQLITSQDLNEDRISRYIETDFNEFATINEKIFNVMDVILQNVSRLDLINIITFISLLITKSDEKIAVVNFYEFILQHFHLLTTKENEEFLIRPKLITGDNTPLDKLLENISHVNQETKNFTKPIHLVAYLMGVFTLRKISLPLVSIMTYELITDTERYNEKYSREILLLYRNITKDKIFEVEDDFWVSGSETELMKRNNFNKIYFLQFFSNKIVTKDIYKLTMVSLEDPQSRSERLIQALMRNLSKINDEHRLSEEREDKINFASDFCFLEIYQIINISFIFENDQWIYEKIFVDIFWKEFCRVSEGSIKRMTCVYFISFILHLFMTKDPNCEKEQTKMLLSWVYSIIDPKFNSQKISLYDKIAALSWFVNTSLAKLNKETHAAVKIVVNNLLTQHREENFPEDFLCLLRKIGFLS